MEHRQTDFVIQFGFENWIIKSFCLCSTTDGIILRNLYPSRRRTSLVDRIREVFSLTTFTKLIKPPGTHKPLQGTRPEVRESTDQMLNRVLTKYAFGWRKEGRFRLRRDELSLRVLYYVNINKQFYYCVIYIEWIVRQYIWRNFQTHHLTFSCALYWVTHQVVP